MGSEEHRRGGKVAEASCCSASCYKVRIRITGQCTTYKTLFDSKQEALYDSGEDIANL